MVVAEATDELNDARNIATGLEYVGRRFRFLVRGRDTKLTPLFAALAPIGTEAITTSTRPQGRTSLPKPRSTECRRRLRNCDSDDPPTRRARWAG